MFSFLFVDDIENSIISFNINIDVDLIFDFVFYCFSYDLIDDSAGISISDLTDDSVIEASTWSMTHEAEKDFVIWENKNKNLCV